MRAAATPIASPGAHRVVRDLSLRLSRGQIGCLLGESGCGKTTVARTIAGFEPLQAGRILLNGQEVDVLVRPEGVVHDDASPVKAEVIRRHVRGANVLDTLCLGNGDQVQALVPSHCDHTPGEKIGIRSDLRHLVMFPRKP